jgi:molybdopterin-guanine dinucleotide biosynthesis protein B
MDNHHIPLLGIVAFSGTGKTSLLKALIPYLQTQGKRIGIIKHTHHNVDFDTPGKDSYELRKAGATQTMIASEKRWALMTETPKNQKFDLRHLASNFDPQSLDLILVEGFKHENIDKIALFRDITGKALSDLLDPYVIALASDTTHQVDLPQLDLNNVAEVGQFILTWLTHQTSQQQIS